MLKNKIKNVPLLADYKGELLQRGRRQVHVKVNNHVRQLREVKLDAVEHPSLVRILQQRKGPAAFQQAANSSRSATRHGEKYQQRASL